MVDVAKRTQTLDDLSGLTNNPLGWMILHGAGFGSCSGSGRLPGLPR